MRVSLRWLREYIDFDLGAEELARRLTMAGIEVGAIERVGDTWENIVVGQVVALEQHPNADRLKLATVDLGGEQLTVICGAPNVATGQRIAFARVGARLFDESGQLERLKAARIRGVLSEGMVCSERELNLGEDHTGILVLPEDAPLGQPMAGYLGDTILQLEVTPNRPDCLSMIGVAWEVAAVVGGSVRMPETAYEEDGKAISHQAAVEVQDPDLCPRYTASLVTGLTVGPSPAWMQERLQAAGMRPINNLVDVTNYVMLEYGQPLHAFDFATLEEGRISVRRAASGEVLTTLDGVDRELSSEDLVIADSRVPVALAGVMGGAGTEVSPTTTTVLLESATFTHTAVRRTASLLKLRSEASLRFEKGLNPDLPVPALRRATRLLVEFGGGRAASGILDTYPGRRQIPPLRLESSQVARVLGIDVPRERMVEVFRSLGFQTQEVDGTTVEVTPPFWRSDLHISEDLVEELARTIGYDAIPTTLPRGAPPAHAPDPMRDLKDALRQALPEAGMQEVITYSLVSKRLLDLTAPEGAPEPMRVWNPMSSEQEYLRTTLRGSLLGAFATNQRASDTGLRLFELGRVYLGRAGDLPEERETLAAVLGGRRTGLSWLREEGLLDFFDAKGILEAVLESQGVRATYRPAANRGLHPGRAAEVLVAGERVGLVGEVHPDLLQALDILTLPVALFELDIPALLPHLSGARYTPATRFPGVVRDLAFLVDAEAPAGAVEDVLRSFPSVALVTLFDVYTGDPLPAGKTSLAFRLVYQNPTRTLTDREVDIAQAQLLEKMERETGAVLRG